jgi:hypothetical protein
MQAITIIAEKIHHRLRRQNSHVKATAIERIFKFSLESFTLYPRDENIL